MQPTTPVLPDYDDVTGLYGRAYLKFESNVEAEAFCKAKGIEPEVFSVGGFENGILASAVSTPVLDAEARALMLDMLAVRTRDGDDYDYNHPCWQLRPDRFDRALDWVEADRLTCRDDKGLTSPEAPVSPPIAPPKPQTRRADVLLFREPGLRAAADATA